MNIQGDPVARLRGMAESRAKAVALILAGVAGYFTKPTEAQHRQAAQAIFAQAPGAAEALSQSDAQERAIAEGELPVAPLITGEVDLDGVAGAFEALGNPDDHCKILVTP